ncbi:MAG: hypothetical protein OHK0046_11140 [Anaerolineae bacterium]
MVTHPQVFISYSFSNYTVDFIEALERRLSEKEISFWRDETNISPGDNWSKAIENALTHCIVVIVVVTPQSISSQYVTFEWSYARGLGKKVIAILYDGNEEDIHPKLKEYQYIDFRGGVRKWDYLLQTLTQAISEQTSVLSSSKLVEQSQIINTFYRIAENKTTGKLEINDIINGFVRNDIIENTEAQLIRLAIEEQYQRISSNKS